MTIDQLQIEISSSGADASQAIEKLAASLTKLKAAVKGGSGLTTTTKQLQAFSDVIQKMSLPGQKINELVNSLKPLETIGQSKLGTALNQLKKIPEVTKALEKSDMSKFASQIQQVVTSVKPLADEMEKVGFGFSKLPTQIQRAINANSKMTQSNRKSRSSFTEMASAANAVNWNNMIYWLRRAANSVQGWILESNKYVEDLNLFTASMGGYAEEAKKYAESVSEIVGIDPSEWMRNQGVFMTLATGFGVVSDRSLIMSKNLTQLGYDLSSFFNTDTGDAMQRLQSAISGELEPVRRWGFDLSQARLKQEALNLSISKNVSEMTQAEKAQLRYYAIMTQVTTAQGDMARSLHAPANQVRIFQAQLTQAARALGNIFIPALNAVLPYAIAFLKVVRTIADELAVKFGFELPEIDYSGIGNLSTNVDEADLALEDATKQAKELDKAISGIDELNIYNESASKQLDDLSNLNDEFNFKLPEYDFLDGLVTSKVNDIAEKMEKPFRNILDTVIKVGGALLGWKVVKSVSNTLGWFANKQNLANLKKGIGLTLMVTGFALEFDAFKNIGRGDGKAQDWIKGAIGAAMGIGGSLLLFGTGPLGWTVGVGLAISVAIAGLEIGNTERMHDYFNRSFFDGIGNDIGDLTQYFETLTTATKESNKKILVWGDDLAKNKGKIDSARTDMDKYIQKMETVGNLSETELADLISSLREIRDLSKESFSIEMNTLIEHFGKKLSSAAGSGDTALQRLIDRMYEFQALFDTRTDTVTDQIEKLLTTKNSGSWTSTQQDELDYWTKQFSGLTQSVSQNTTDFNQRIKDLQTQKIDWNNHEKAISELQKIKTMASEVLSESKDAEKQLLNTADNMLAKTNYLGLSDSAAKEWRKYWENIKRAEIPTSFEKERAEIKTNLEGLYSWMSADVSKGMDKAVSDYLENNVSAWDELKSGVQTGWAKMFGAATDDFTATNQLRSNVRDTIEEQFKGITSELQSAVSEFDLSLNNFKGVDFYNRYVIAAQDIVGGLKSEIANQTDNLYEQGVKIGTSVEDGTRSALDIHSPSRVFAEIGVDTVQGFVNGIKSQFLKLIVLGSTIGTLTQAGLLGTMPFVAAIMYKAGANLADGEKGGTAGFGMGVHSMLNRLTSRGRFISNTLKQGVLLAESSTAAALQESAKRLTNSFMLGFSINSGGIETTFKNLFNSILDLTERFSSIMQNTMYFTAQSVASVAPQTGSFSVPVMPERIEVPRLAKGTVIPPRNPYLAIVGGQRSGTNVETPLSTIQEAVGNVVGGKSEALLAQAVGLLQEIADKPSDVSVQVNDTEIARASNSGNKKLGYAVKR